MAVAIFPKKWNRKPPTSVRIDWGHPLTYRMTGCWHFTPVGGKVVQDLASQNNALMDAGTSWVNTAGEDSVSCNFGGSSRAVVGNNNSSVDLTADMTIQARINQNSVGVPRGIVSKRRTSDDQGYGLYIAGGGEAYFPYYNVSLSATTAFALTNGVWYDIVGVRKSGTDYIYTNGVRSASTFTGADRVGLVTDRLVFADIYESSPGFYFNGLICHVRLWERALSSDEVAWLYAEPYTFLRPKAITRFYFKKPAAGGGATPINAVMTEDMNL